MIAILESDIKRVCAMRRALQGKSLERQMVYFENAPFMISWLKDNIASVQVISLNYSLRGAQQVGEGAINPGTGLDVIHFLATRKASCQVLIHTADQQGLANMSMALLHAGWNCSAVIRKSSNWIEEDWLKAIQQWLPQPSYLQLLT